VPLELVETSNDPLRPSPDAAQAARERLAALRAREEERMLRMEYQHKIESFIYAALSKLELELMDVVTTPDELVSLREAFAAASSWLDEEGFGSPAVVLKEWLSDLEGLLGPVLSRRDEYEQRPAAVEELQETFESLEASKTLPDQFWDEAAFERVRKIVQEVQDWLAEKLAEQDKLSPTEEPALLVSELRKRSKRVKRLVRDLRATPEPKPVEPKNPGKDETGENSSGEKPVEGDQSAEDEQMAEDEVQGSDGDAEQREAENADGKHSEKDRDEL